MSAARPTLTVLSTHATDILLDKDRIEMRRQEGGPAFFIESVLTKEGVPFMMHSGPRINVEILVTDEGEFGKIEKTAPDQEPPPVTSPFLLVSTVLNEWPLELPSFVGKQFVDIQGYVRDGLAFGRKHELSIPLGFKPFCIKGTTEEISYLPEPFVLEQKNRCLIVTKGAEGADVYVAGVLTEVRPREVVRVADTIGAGDTFFSYVVAAYIETADMVESVRTATDKTSQFLRETKRQA